jgi:Tfp pilus assembly protein PilZ
MYTMSDKTESKGDEPYERASPRYEVSAFVDYAGGEVLLHHRIQNISLGGICIQSPSIEEVGSMVDLVVNFPDLGRSLALRGQVVWANREPPMDMGIRYIEMDDSKRSALREYLDRVAADGAAQAQS